MHFGEREVGDFRIYAGALDVPQGGYIAGVVVHQVRGTTNGPILVFKDDQLYGGHRFAEPRDALTRALDSGNRAIRAYAARTGASKAPLTTD